jgi:hypothetical protein
MAKVILNKPEVRKTATEAILPSVERTLDQTLALAKRLVPVRKPKPFDRRPAGRLKRSLIKRGPKKLVNRVEGEVGSRLAYAASIHDGAKPHPIFARRKKNLVFYWQKEDVTFVGKKVNHPGVRKRKRKQFLYLPLRVAGLRNGFKVRRLAPTKTR